jgi:hypothetical protein
MFMHSPVERKFNEYFGKIHLLLHDDATFLEDPAFINHLLDRLEYIKRNFILLNAEKEDVFIYQDYLSRLAAYSQETQWWVENYKAGETGHHEASIELKETLFLLSDMFSTSQNLIKSFYPVI